MNNDNLNIQEDAKSDWMSLVNKHKKKQKGLPALSTLNTNAGNVEHNINMFNMMQPDRIATVDASNGNVSSGESTCCESLDLFEGLSPSKPYMLRYDGKVFTCGEYHPYIKPILDSNIKLVIRNLFERHKDKLKWFYDHTLDADTRLNIITVINSVISNCEQYKLNLEDITNYRKIFDTEETSSVNTFDLEALVDLLNQKTNQEFCRFRTSDRYSEDSSSKDIYFRISSHGFNWFDLIWKFVFDNKNWIETVTIEGDAQAGKSNKVYKHNNIVINKLPIEEFIQIEGNPLIEKIDMQHGYKLEEAYRKSNPYFWVTANEVDYDNFVDKNFVLKDEASVIDRSQPVTEYKGLDDKFDMSMRTLL